MKNFTYPYKSAVLIFSAAMIFLPVFILGPFGYQIINSGNRVLLKLIILIPSLFSTLGFIYCTLGYHFQILRGDELKLRIHLEALNISFTAMLVLMFGLIFVFINFFPNQLNYLLIYLAVIGIIAYVAGIEIVKRKYQ